MIFLIMTCLPLLQVLEALYGKSPLFAVRMTHLGDGTSLVAITWVHDVADGDSSTP